MKIVWKQGAGILTYGGIAVPCSCAVRNEVNRLRKINQVVRTMPNGRPYMPRIFPKGIWEVGMPVPRSSIDRAPYFIPTNAWQDVPVWGTAEGHYTMPTGEIERDTGYGLHYSEYDTTLGCIRISDKDDLLVLVRAIREALANNEKVVLEVI